MYLARVRYKDKTIFSLTSSLKCNGQTHTKDFMKEINHVILIAKMCISIQKKKKKEEEKNTKGKNKKQTNKQTKKNTQPTKQRNKTTTKKSRFSLVVTLEN